jgi:hypothetical protein
VYAKVYPLETLVDRYTLYPVAPLTVFHVTVMLLDEAAVAFTPAGALGADPPGPLE